MENHEGIKRIGENEKEKPNIKKKKEENLKRNNKISKKENFT